MPRRLCALLGCVFLASTVQADELYRFGRLGDRLLAEDVTAIATVVGPEGTPWALEGWQSQVLPEVWYVDVFMAPTVSTKRLRRGRVVHLECSPAAGARICGHWKPAEASGAYVQVADGPTFPAAAAPATPRERPIRVVGQLSDSDLLALVTYIRSGPAPRASEGSIGMMLPGGLPITDVHLEQNRSVRAWLSPSRGIGYSATFTLTMRGWVMTEVVGGVA